MCAANDELEMIHDAEEEAAKRIQELQQRAKGMKEQTEDEARQILTQAEEEARRATVLSTSDIDRKKAEIEQRIRDETDAAIAKLRESARSRRTAAIRSVADILLWGAT